MRHMIRVYQIGRNLVMATTWILRKEKVILLSLVLIAAIMNCFLMIRNPNIGGDALIYLLPIHNLMDGKGYSYAGSPSLIFPPGYGILSYLFFLAIRDIELSGMFVSALSYFLIIITTYYTARFLFGKRCAILSAFLVTFCLTLISFSYVNLSDCTFSLFLLLSFSIYVCILIGKTNITRSILLGAILGFTYLIRPEGFIVAVLATLVLFIFAIVDMKHSKELVFSSKLRALSYPAVTVLAFLIFALPYILFIHKHTQSWTISCKTSAVLHWGEIVTEESSYHIDLLRIEHPEYFQPGFRIDLFDYIRSRGPKFLVRIKRNTRSEFLHLGKINFHALIPLVLLWFVFPFLSTRKLFPKFRLDSRSIRIVLSFIVFLSPLIVLLIAFMCDRYLLPYSLFILILLAFFIIRFLERILESLERKWFSYGLILICIVSLLSLSGYVPIPRIPSPSLYRTLTARHGHLGLRAAGFWLRDQDQNLDNLTIIAPQKGEVALFYASGKKEPRGRAMAIPPNMTLEEVAALVSTAEVDYLLLDSHYINTRPQLIPLWNNPSLASEYGLFLVHTDSDELFQIYSSEI